MNQNFIDEIKSRGFFHQCTDIENLSKLINNKPVKAYIGFDCTAPSLHVGSLLQIMCLRLLQKYGHQPIVLLGGGTTHRRHLRRPRQPGARRGGGFHPSPRRQGDRIGQRPHHLPSRRDGLRPVG